MNNKTGTGLCEYAKAQIGKPYWWGTFGQISTKDLLDQKRKQYPDYYGASDFEKQLGVKVHDCSGLIKGYLWSGSPTEPAKYNGSQDVAVDGLYRNCSDNGNINGIPEIPGALVFRRDLGHVGVYIGNGKVVEAMGHAYGVVQTNLGSRNWAFWGKLNWLDYGGAEQPKTEEPKTEPSNEKTCTISITLPILSRGSRGIAVKKMQALLIASGFDCGPDGADGDFGYNTQNALKKYQKANGLKADGIAGQATFIKLYG